MEITLKNLFFVIFVINIKFGESLHLKRSSSTCGSATRQAGLIYGGDLSTRGEFPWLVALMFAGSGAPAFIGGGTLISDRHVITAAHCIKPKDGPYTEFFPADLIVQFGAFNLSNSHELGKHSLAPEKIIVHDDWNPNVASYDADIAILVFEKGSIPLTRYVQPVCLWLSETAPQVTKGLVAGWGRSEGTSRRHEEVPKKIKLPIRTNEDCLIKSPGLVKLFSKRTFCAGLDDGSGVCMGDSGNGFIVLHEDLYYLRGIVSSSLLSDSRCDVFNNAIYTDVMKFIPWIIENVNDDGNLFILVQSTTEHASSNKSSLNTESESNYVHAQSSGLTSAANVVSSGKGVSSSASAYATGSSNVISMSSVGASTGSRSDFSKFSNSAFGRFPFAEKFFNDPDWFHSNRSFSRISAQSSASSVTEKREKLQ